MRLPLKERARGRWRSILPQLGVDASYLTGKQMACPVCRAGTDRFTFDDQDGNGTWICRKCIDQTAGDGIALAMRVNGWSFKEAADRIEPLIGSAPVDKVKRKATEDENREALNRLWASSSPISAGDPVALFLGSRVGLTSFPRVLRCAPRCRYREDDGSASFHPAMVAMLQAPDGMPASLHRTWLTSDGRKAQVGDPRRTMPGTIAKGSAVRLFPPGPCLGIAEGIETAFAAASLFGLPVWSAVNATLLSQWCPPNEATEIVIFGDCDPQFGGQAAAYALAHRLSIEAKRDGIERTFRIEIPPKIGVDWNDVLHERAAA